jgi:hypothetical protein
MTHYRLSLALTEVEIQHLVDCVFISADASVGDDEQFHADSPETVEALTERVYQKVLAASRATGYEPAGFGAPVPGDGAAHRAALCAKFPIGTRVRLTQDVERYPHFIARAGMVGTVTENASGPGEVFAVKMDETLENCTEWDNEVCWVPSDDDTPWDEIEEVR